MITTQAACVLFWSQYAYAMSAVHANECRKGDKPFTLPRVRVTVHRQEDSADDILCSHIDSIADPWLFQELDSGGSNQARIARKKHAARMREYTRTHREKIREYARKYNKANREEISTKARLLYRTGRAAINNTATINKEF